MTPLRRAVPELSLKPLAAFVLGTALVAAQAPAAIAEEAATSSALQAKFAFDIAAQPLPQALSEFSRVSGLSVVYTDDAPYDLKAPAVSGQLSGNDALNRLLAGSGYRFRALDGHTLTLERLPVDTLSLNDTTVTGQTAATSYQPAPVASIGRTDTLVLETPQSIVTVPAQALRDQKPRNLDDALGNVSGVTQANTLGGTQDAVMKRGFGDNRDGSIMRDGLPSVLGRNLTATADHVEVLKGPASVLYGIQDPGGVVNVVSKKPQLQQYNAVTLRGSTFAHGKQGSGAQIDTTGALGESNLAYRLIVDHQDENYWRNFGQQRETLVAPSLAWFGEDTTINLSYEHREFKTPFDRGTAIDPRTNRPLDIPRSRRLDEPFNITEGRSDLSRLDIEHRLDDAWKAHFAYGWTRETYDDNQARVTKVNGNGNGTVTRRVDGTHGAVSSDSFATASLNGDLQLGGFRHELVVGVDSEKRKIYRADLIRDTKNTTLNYLDPVYGQISPATRVSPSDSDQTDKLRSDSLFLQDSWHLDDHWILVAGGRYQMYDQYAGRGRPFKANTDISGQKWVPRAGVIYKINDEMSLYGSYTQSFKPNSTIAPLSTGEVIDSAIQPEEASSWEIGGKLDMPGRVTANLAFFDIRKRNVMVTQLDANGDSRVSTAGKVRSYGAELDVTGQLTDSWSLLGSYAWLDAEVTEDPELEGNRLQNVAKETASLTAVYDAGSLLGGDDLRLGGGARYVGKRAGDPSNSFELPSYTVADAFASYDTKVGGHNVGFQFNVKNLFDRTYYPSAANNLYVAIGEPRQFEFSTTVEF